MKALTNDNSKPRKAPAAARSELTLVARAPAAERAADLFRQAREASLEHLETLSAAIEQTHALARTVAEGSDLYTPALQDFTRRLADELEWRSKTLAVLADRQRSATH